jgi:hypothetical protein
MENENYGLLKNYLINSFQGVFAMCDCSLKKSLASGLMTDE